MLALAMGWMLLAALPLERPEAGLRAVEVPFERSVDGDVLLIRLLLNGRPATFVLDTGAGASIVGVHALGVEGFRLRLARFKGVGLEGEAVRVRTGSLKLAGRTFPEPTLVAMDLSGLTSRLGTPVDGLLGQDLLSRFDRVSIDFTRQIVEFVFAVSR